MTWALLGRGLWMFVTSFVGTFGFALVLHAPRKAWLPSSVMGGLAYTLYWTLMQLGMGEPSAIFLGALAGSLMAQYCARRMRMIATVFLLLSIIALVPGLGLYRCMALLAEAQYSAGLQTGVQAMTSVVMIALGVGVGSFLYRLLAFGPRRARDKGGHT